MKVTENLNENISTELSDDTMFVKSILMKAKNGTLMKKSSLQESMKNESSIKTICEDFNSGKVVLTPMNEHDVVMAYHPHVNVNGECVTITGHSTIDHGGEPNVTINLSMDEFFRLLSIN